MWRFGDECGFEDVQKIATPARDAQCVRLDGVAHVGEDGFIAVSPVGPDPRWQADLKGVDGGRILRFGLRALGQNQTAAFIEEGRHNGFHRGGVVGLHQRGTASNS